LTEVPQGKVLHGQEQNKHNRKILVALAGLIVIVPFGVPFRNDLRTLLLEMQPAPSEQAVDWVLSLTAEGISEPDLGGVPTGPLYDIEVEHAATWEALYLMAAVDRMDAAGVSPVSKARETRYFEQHKVAVERRLRSAALADVTRQLVADRDTPATEGLLGWRAVMDERTTNECRAANGQNFRADRMPTIGWPGAVHPHCRCSAAPAIPGAPLLRSV
jgi:SPP1 gp7 family putative phage head morphogenesis protein